MTLKSGKLDFAIAQIRHFGLFSANCTIDRGSWRNTIIGKGSKLDNLVGAKTIL
jgi:hypothetical protein